MGVNYETTPDVDTNTNATMNETCTTLLLNLTTEPSLQQCIPAFQAAPSASCPSLVTWGCYSVLSMTVLASCTLLIVLFFSCAQSVREGSLWIQTIYGATLLQGVLYVTRYAFVPNDLLVIAATTVESEVIVIAAYILTWICVELHTTRSNLSDTPSYMERVARNVVVPFLVVVGITLVVLLVLTILGLFGNENNCHQLAWFLISSLRASCVIVSTVSAVLIQKKMSTMAVSEGYRKSKVRMVWLVAFVFVFATLVELGNDAWAATRPLDEHGGGACWKWSSISIDVFTHGDDGPMVSLRVLVRTCKFFLPMWAVLAFFKALMPERQVKNRAMSWASGIGGGDNEDEWSVISGCTPRGARTEPLRSGGEGGEGGENEETWDDGSAEALYAPAERRRSSGGLAAVVDVVDGGPRGVLVGRDLLREKSSSGSVN